MADPKNDIIITVKATDDDIAGWKKEHYDAGGGTRQQAPVAQHPTGLNAQLVNMLTLGKTYYNFQGLDRCIRILDPNTPNKRHCGAMMVRNSSTNQFMCSNCDRVKDPNAHPKVINSAMIRLSGEDLKELGLKEDPLAGMAELVNPKPEKPKRTKKLKSETETKARRAKMPVPNKVIIEVTVKELEESTDIPVLLMQKALESVFNLPIAKYSDAEKIRTTSDRIREFLNNK